MELRALDVVKRCYSNADGQLLYKAIVDYIRRGEEVTISFDGVDTLPSSFVNSAFIHLLDEFSFDHIKSTLYFRKTTPQINEMIKTRFKFEIEKRRVP